jgi:regulator of sigma E protease
MGTILGTIFSFLIVFGILVFIHELGHFMIAKMVGIRVEVFSFGYGKRLFGVKKGQTDYRISLFPMGGYVKFLGEGVFDPGKAVEPDDFSAKTRFQRFLVIIMGPVMNILLAILIVAGINMVGVSSPEYQDQAPVIGWIEPGSPAANADLRPDDQILADNGRKTATWTDVEIAVGSKPERLLSLEIRRDGEIRTVPLTTESRTKYDRGYAGFFGKILTQVQMVTPGSPAEKAGLQAGDVIKAINGEPVFFYKFISIVEANAEKESEFLIDRGTQTANSVLKKFTFFPALGQSVKENKRLAFLVIDFLKNLVTGQASAKQLGGPLEIANLSYAALRMGFLALMSWIAFISLQLGILNLFPIPVFDGGQLFVLIIEGIIRRDLNPKARQIWMQIGFVIFVALIAFVILNDIVKRLPNGWKSLLPF